MDVHPNLDDLESVFRGTAATALPRTGVRSACERNITPYFHIETAILKLIE
jgi:hypothetical protein